ncbi:urea amidolyase associated protein UAAP1 [Emcibacter nanhaiensis]|uniref:DUF1989 domain-containing protein n=1 Tax=Emcibacter nanhaiensis TaxID=1505037 RepID=A0A501PJX1_9PROT|nr:urea amidolyase associated protein UAAP1 [Emcibacter nanhaiensis]TPD60194.1 DUF1989 domain-containing protein [Emcibacter nanhaiensis]
MSESQTADPALARVHARQQAGTKVEAMRTIPSSAAVNLPEGVSPEEVIWDEVIASGGYAIHSLTRGDRLQIIDLHGDGCISLNMFNAQHPAERLNAADSIKVQWKAYLGTGDLILSGLGRVLASIMRDDDCGIDPFCGASSRYTVLDRYGDNSIDHPNARDRFLTAAAKCGLSRKDVHPCLNIFKPVQISESGETQVDTGPFAPGRVLELRAEMNLLVFLANCPHVLDVRPEYSVSPVRALAWKGEETRFDDPVRNATPEGLRAFENVEDYFRNGEQRREGR